MKTRRILVLALCLSMLLCFALTSCAGGLRLDGSYENTTSLLITSTTTKYTFSRNGNVTIKTFLGSTLLTTTEAKYEVSKDQTEITITVTSTSNETDENGATQAPTTYGGTYKFAYTDDSVTIGSTTYTKVGKK